MGVADKSGVNEVSLSGTLELDSGDSDFGPAANLPAERAERELPLPRDVARPPRSRRRPRQVPAIVIDRSALFRAGLSQALVGGRFRIVANRATLDQLEASVFGDGPCVALVGLDKDAEDVLTTVSVLKARHRELRVVFLGDQDDPRILLAAIAAGGDGYLLKNEASPDTLVKSLEVVLAEGVVVPPGFTKSLIGREHLPLADEPAGLSPMPAEEHPLPTPPLAEEQPEAPQPEGLDRLSARERVILVHLTQGASNKHIARALNIAEATVKVHVKSLLRKIHVNNRTQAAMWAVACGKEKLVPPTE